MTYIPFYKPYGMTDEEYEYEVRIAHQKAAEEELDNRLNEIYDYVTNVFIKQNRVLKFDELWGDGTIWNPFNKKEAKEFYNSILNAWQEHNISKCTWCNGTGYIRSYEDKFKCGHCNLDLDEFIK